MPCCNYVIGCPPAPPPIDPPSMECPEQMRMPYPQGNCGQAVGHDYGHAHTQCECESHPQPKPSVLSHENRLYYLTREERLVRVSQTSDWNTSIAPPAPVVVQGCTAVTSKAPPLTYIPLAVLDEEADIFLSEVQPVPRRLDEAYMRLFDLSSQPAPLPCGIELSVTDGNKILATNNAARPKAMSLQAAVAGRPMTDPVRLPHGGAADILPEGMPLMAVDFLLFEATARVALKLKLFDAKILLLENSRPACPTRSVTTALPQEASVPLGEWEAALSPTAVTVRSRTATNEEWKLACLNPCTVFSIWQDGASAQLPADLSAQTAQTRVFYLYNTNRTACYRLTHGLLPSLTEPTQHMLRMEKLI